MALNEDLTIRPDTPNEDVDARVLTAIQDGARKFEEICVRLGLVTFKCDFRVVDRSLQRLRRADKIYFDKKEQKWHTVE